MTRILFSLNHRLLGLTSPMFPDRGSAGPLRACPDILVSSSAPGVWGERRGPAERWEQSAGVARLPLSQSLPRLGVCGLDSGASFSDSGMGRAQRQQTEGRP